MTLSIAEAVNISRRIGGSVSVNASGELERDNFTTWLWRKVSRSANDAAVTKVLAYVNEHMEPETSPAGLLAAVSERGTTNEDLLKLGRCVLKAGKSTKSKGLRAELSDLDRRIYRLYNPGNRERTFVFGEQQAAYDKWLANGFPEQLFFSHPEFVSFIFGGYIHSCMALYNHNPEEYPHTIRLDTDGEPLLLFQGEWTRWDQISDQFEIRRSELFQEKMIFKKGEEAEDDAERTVYTYLGGDKGLSAYNPYTFQRLETIHKLGGDDVAELQRLGNEFRRDGEDDEQRQVGSGERRYVLQIVSSQVGSKWVGNPLLSGYHAIIGRPRHPWFRLVSPDGDVKEVGFNAFKPPSRPAVTVRGRFRSPDAWGFKPADRYVTNIAIDASEAENFEEYVMSYQRRVFHNQPPHERNGRSLVGFNFVRQNCSAFVVNALQHVLQMRPDIEVTFSRFLANMIPMPIQRAVAPIRSLAHRAWVYIASAVVSCPDWASRPMVWIADKVSRLVDMIRGFIAVPIVLAAGGVHGETGLAMNGERAGAHRGRVRALLEDVRGWFTTKTSTMYMPAMLQQWQVNEQSAATQVIRRQRGMALYNRD